MNAQTPEPESGTPLHERERQLSFDRYLQGREYAYEQILHKLRHHLTQVQKTQAKYPNDFYMWELTTGQHDALNEMLKALKALKG